MGYAALFFAALFVLLTALVLHTIPGPQDRPFMCAPPILFAFAAFLALAAASILSAMTLVD